MPASKSHSPRWQATCACRCGPTANRQVVERRSRKIRQALDQAQQRRRSAGNGGKENREYRKYHLGTQVRQQADEAQFDDVGVKLGASCAIGRGWRTIRAGGGGHDCASNRTVSVATPPPVWPVCWSGTPCHAWPHRGIAVAGIVPWFGDGNDRKVLLSKVDAAICVLPN